MCLAGQYREGPLARDDTGHTVLASYYTGKDGWDGEWECEKTVENRIEQLITKLKIDLEKQTREFIEKNYIIRVSSFFIPIYLIIIN